MWVGLLICLSLVNLIFLPGVFAQPQQEWDKLVAAAEKEGEVTIYGQARAGVAKSIHAFAEAYPKIKINFVGGQGSDLSKKVFAERRAGKHLVDVAVGGGPPMILYHKAGALKSLPEILVSPEIRDLSKWWGKRHFYADSDNRYVFMSQGDAGSGIGAINTGSVKASEIKSWWDLLNPKWKGKFVMNDPRGLGNVGSWRFLYYDDDLGAKYLRRLVAEMDVVFAQDERQMMDWLAAGKYQINLLAKIENTASARKQGLPVAQIFSDKEGDAIASGSGSYQRVQRRAPSQCGAALRQLVFVTRRSTQLAEAHRQKLISHGSAQGHARIPGDTGPQRGRQVHADEFGEIRRHRAGAKIGRGTFR